MKYLFMHFLVWASLIAVAQNPDNSLLIQGHELFNQGEYQKAESKLQAFLKLANQNSIQQEVFNALYLLGSIANEYQNYSKAIILLEQAKQKLQSTPENTNNSILVEAALGTAYLGNGQFFQAEKKLTEAHTLAQKKDPFSISFLLHTAESLATYYLAIMDFYRAEKILTSQIQAARLDSTVLKLVLAQAINKLGETYLATNKPQMAKSLFDEATALCQSNWTAIHPQRQSIIRNQVTVARMLGNMEEAIALARSSYITSKVSLGVSHPDFALAAAELGILFSTKYLEEDIRMAVDFLSEAKAILEKTSGERHPKYPAILSYLAWAKYKLSWFTDTRFEPRNTEADKLFRRSLSLTYENIDNVFVALTEAEKIKYYDNLEPIFKNFSNYVKGETRYDYESADKSRLSDWYDMVLATKGLLFQSNSQLRERILTIGNTDQIKKFNVWQSFRDSLAVAFQKGDASAKKKWSDQVSKLEKELSQVSASFGRSMTKKVTWRDVQKALKPNEAAVEIVQYDEVTDEGETPFYGALVIRHDKKTPDLIPLSKLPTIDPLQFIRPDVSAITRDVPAMNNRWFKLYKNSILFDIPDYTSYLIYWRPLDFYLQGIKKIYYSPDGIFNLINLATLRIPNEEERYDKKSLVDLTLEPTSYHFSQNQFLGDVLEIETVLTTKDIVSPSYPLDKLSQVMLFGYPNYNGSSSPTDKGKVNRELEEISFVPAILSDTSQRFFSGNNINELPGTKIEVENIRNLLEAKEIKCEVFMESLASEAEIRKIQSPSVLHIATHGYFLSKRNTENSAIAEHPLMRAGLLFSGAKNAFNPESAASTTDNGVLTAWEALGLNLDETRLVVLSACETGLGDIQNGDGVYGLQRAFQLAGAKAVLMSLWTVPDEATQKLMTEFYTQWLTGLPMRAAFNKAQQKIKLEYPNPHDWGGFVLIGN